MRRLDPFLLAALCLFFSGPSWAFTTVRLTLQWVFQTRLAGHYVAFVKGFCLRRALDVSAARGGPDRDREITSLKDLDGRTMSLWGKAFKGAFLALLQDRDVRPRQSRMGGTPLPSIPEEPMGHLDETLSKKTASTLKRGGLIGEAPSCGVFRGLRR
ncbi:MAG: hypothetical protein JMJ93_01885 [Synergistaceae bacterium]|nr:hypothetical protein [Synergistaceae bacterium]